MYGEDMHAITSSRARTLKPTGNDLAGVDW